jgi:acyl-CoA synthetase (NDP forming)
VVNALFAPRSIAIVGASERAGSYGGEAMLNLARFGYPGRVYPVNPKRPIVHGFDAYPSLGDLPEAPDAVVVAIPDPEEVIESAAAMGCGGAIVFTAQTDEPRLAAAGLPLCGPNGNGIVSVPDRVAMWGDVIVPREAGPVALISQSGNVAVNALASRRGLRLHTVVSCGNSAVLDAADFLAAIAQREGVRSVALYLEADGDGPRWCSALERCAHAGIGVAVLKAGSSRAGAAAAEAHTGAIAGDQRIVRAFFEAAGAAWAEDPHDLLELAKALAVRRPPSGRGAVVAAGDGVSAPPRDVAAGTGVSAPTLDVAAGTGVSAPTRGVAVMTCSGGDSAVAADIAAGLGLDLPALAPATIERLNRTLPDVATAANPLDYTALLWGDPIALQELMMALGEDPNVGLVLVLYDDAGGGDEGWAAVLGAVQAAGIDSPTPVALASTLPELLDDETACTLQRAGMAAIAGLRSGIRAARALTAPPPDPRRIAAMATQKRSTGSRWLQEHEAKAILRDAGVPVPDGRVTDDPVSAWQELQGPVAIKRLGLRHKAVRDGVKLNLDDEAAVRDAFPGETVLVERMAPPGRELIVSIRRDGLTPVLVVGLGGIHTEQLDRAEIHPLPATGIPAPIRDIAAKLAELPFALIELNPVIVHRDGAIAVDALALEED